ncbi:hypothetical protein DUNSADRAFT_15424 [Dunaliella salina]|uniref:Uncharacterized protein n=1 Tax=Dunaliella salina TaxID=3046 RepID=A0ABQ7G5F3_DUNSA|nr:hypothetical protein DUNSADRAFT_15424 [Dunaliella salina]|eukprot:KAF5829840.1 hypothetical protein DUNSADRAFT_15424 [Dunaliella salina]
MLSRLSRAISLRACTAPAHHCFSISAALPFQQQDPSESAQTVGEEEEPKAVLEARKREAARSYVARKIFGSAHVADLQDSSVSHSVVGQDREGCSQDVGNGSNVSLGAATTSRASTQAGSPESSSTSSSSSSSSSSPNTDADQLGSCLAGGSDWPVRNELARLLKEHQVVVRGGQADSVAGGL